MKEVYPGIDNRFVICDVCGKKFRVRDTVQISDRYNLLNKMIVCKADADKVNPQIYPIFIKENLLTNREYVRPESADIYLTNADNDQLPSAPRNPRIRYDGDQGGLVLEWDGPERIGSGRTLGFTIKRSTPIGETPITIESGNGNLAMYYVDLNSNPILTYTYTISVLTTLGNGPETDLIQWGEPNYNYLVVSQDNSLLTTSSGIKIVL